MFFECRGRRGLARDLSRLVLGVGIACLTGVAHAEATAPTAQQASNNSVITTYGLAISGQPKLPANFTHFPYVNPDAPKGGTLTVSELGSFDSLNPFIISGVAGAGASYLYNSYLYDTLLTPNWDEPYTEYGLLADGIRIGPKRSWVEFDINPKARFSDGTPVTAQDVVFSYKLLMTKAMPFFRGYFADVKNVSIPRSGVVHFDLKPTAPYELPLDLGQFPVMPEHYWKHHDFTQPSLDIPVGSGPYTITQVVPGSRIVYTRNPNYWGRNLPVMKGRYNANTIIYDYYQDDSVALQAFLSGHVDYRIEPSPASWATNYTGPAIRHHDIIKFQLSTGNPGSFLGYALNMRRPEFNDIRVREALALAFDFDMVNRLLYHGLYTRDVGFYDNSVFQAHGLPDKGELALLDPLRKELPASVFTQSLDGEEPTDIRSRLHKAYDLLRQAGYYVKNNQLYTPKGKPFNIELLLDDPGQNRTALPYAQNLARLGIHLHIRNVDPNQYLVLKQHFAFDMVRAQVPESNSPGAEQASFWGSQYATVPMSQNVAGIANPAIDALINNIIAAKNRPALITATRALDRVLRQEHYFVPLYYQKYYNVARWRQLELPRAPHYGVDIDSWWINPNVHNESTRGGE